ncbi:MAG: Fe2+-dependent dioxygenase [Bacteroidota bacterium]
MNLHIPSLLKPEELNDIRNLITKSEFIDGRSTAGASARSVKNNFQLDGTNKNTEEIQRTITNAITDSPLIQQAILPAKIRTPLISKYEEGMSYGWHVDSPLMDTEKVRTDLAMTLFLNDPATYEGGELILNTNSGQIPYKLPAGDAIIYPAIQVHGVAEVRRGERVVAVTWLQSAIRNNDQRELLFNLSQVQAMLNQQDPNAQHATLLMQCYSNLIRMWAEV